MRNLQRLVFLLLVATSLPSWSRPAEEVLIGVFAYQGERAAILDWAPMIDTLNRALPGHGFRLTSYDAEGLKQAIADDNVDLGPVHTNCWI